MNHGPLGNRPSGLQAKWIQAQHVNCCNSTTQQLVRISQKLAVLVVNNWFRLVNLSRIIAFYSTQRSDCLELTTCPASQKQTWLRLQVKFKKTAHNLKHASQMWSRRQSQWGVQMNRIWHTSFLPTMGTFWHVNVSVREQVNHTSMHQPFPRLSRYRGVGLSGKNWALDNGLAVKRNFLQ